MKISYLQTITLALAVGTLVCIALQPGLTNAADPVQPLAVSQQRPTLPPAPTAGPPRPTYGPTPRPAQAASEPATLCLRLRAAPNTATAPGEIVDYNVAIAQTGGHEARAIELAVLYTAGAQQVVDVTFPTAAGWVTSVQSGSIGLRIERLGSGEVVTATLRLRTLRGAPLGSLLTAQARLIGGANIADDGRRSNTVILALDRVTSSRDTQLLQIGPYLSEDGGAFTVALHNLVPHEQVSLWLQQPDGEVIALSSHQADERGTLNTQLEIDKLASGTYMLVAYGQCSQITAVGQLMVGSS